MNDNVMHVNRKPPGITFMGVGTLCPADDVTPQEAVHISIMLSTWFAWYPADYKKFVADHGLQRHFIPETGND